MSSSRVSKIMLTQRRLVERKKSPRKTSPNKFDQLYDNYKTMQANNEKLKQIILFEREKKHLTECTFKPQTNIQSKKFNKKLFRSPAKKEVNKNKKEMKTDSKIIDLINRQNKWIQNKNDKLNRRIVSETMKNMEKCIFEPQINKFKKRTISNLKTETQKIIDQPQSYLEFIKKTREFRKNKSNSRLYEYPISGDWKSPYKKKNSRLNRINDYDYTKHQLTSKSYILSNKTSSNFISNKSINISNKSFNGKENANKVIQISKIKINNLKGDELYKMVYLEGKEKLNKEIKDYANENLEKLFQGKEKINFKQAIERIHTVLIDLCLDNSKEIEEKENHINGNNNLNDKENNDNKI